MTQFGDAGQAPYVRAGNWQSRRAALQRMDITEENWMLEMARSVRGMNTELNETRQEIDFRLSRASTAISTSTMLPGLTSSKRKWRLAMPSPKTIPKHSTTCRPGNARSFLLLRRKSLMRDARNVKLCCRISLKLSAVKVHPSASTSPIRICLTLAY